jgi:hypothetical protein
VLDAPVEADVAEEDEVSSAPVVVPPVERAPSSPQAKDKLNRITAARFIPTS